MPAKLRPHGAETLLTISFSLRRGRRVDASEEVDRVVESGHATCRQVGGCLSFSRLPDLGPIPRLGGISWVCVAHAAMLSRASDKLRSTVGHVVGHVPNDSVAILVVSHGGEPDARASRSGLRGTGDSRSG